MAQSGEFPASEAEDVAFALKLVLLNVKGNVALSATGAEPALIGAATERQFRGAHVFAMHFNTGFSAHLTSCVEWCGSMQQCHSSSSPTG